MPAYRSYSYYLGENNEFRDYYEFTLSSPTFLTILNPNTGIVGSTVLIPSGDGEGVETFALPAGTYFIENNTSVDEPYQLTFTAQEIPVFTGNTFATARSFGYVTSSVESVSGWLGYAKPLDIYAFSLASSQTVNLLLNGVTQGEDLALYKSNGQEIADDNALAGYATKNASLVENLTAGTYYIEAKNDGDALEQDDSYYSLSVWTGSPNVGTASQNGAGVSLASAHNIGALTSVDFADWVGSTDRDDWYKFTLSAPSFVDMTLAGLTQTADAEILSVTGQPISSALTASGSANNEGSLSANLATGTYYVDVTTQTPGTGYNLALSASPISLNAGSTLATARVLSLGAANSVYDDWIGPADSDDYYKFTVSAQTTLAFSLYGVTAQVGMALESVSGAILDGNQNTFFGASPSFSNTLSYIVQSGTYYLYVHSYSDTYYDLTASATPTPPIGGATEASAYQTGALTTQVKSYNDVVSTSRADDWFAFTLANPGTVNVMLSAPPGVTQPTSILDLYSSVSSIQGAYGHATSDSALVDNVAAGTYYVDVKNDIGLASPFTLSFWLGSPKVGTNGTQTAGETLATAQNVGDLGSRQDFAGWVGSSYQDNVYAFTLAQDSSVNLLLSGASIQTGLTLEDIGGGQIQNETANATDDASIVLDLAAGTYYVDVGYGYGDTGFNLAMSASPVPDAAGTSDATALDIGDLSLATPNDFLGDGLSDILWRNTSTGAVESWLTQASGGFSFAADGAPSSSWQVAGTGDFTGGGKTDILWRNTQTNDTYLYLSNGSGGFSYKDLGIVGGGWQVAGVGDFNDDAIADILWQNSNGAVELWETDPYGGFTYANLGAVPGWQVAAVGDFSGSGYSDILWRNATTGDTVAWYTSPGGGFTYADLGAPPPAWQVAGTGDFGGQSGGAGDILWRNTQTGDAYLYLANGSGGYTYADLGVVPTSWQIAEIGEFGANGLSDILWRNTATGDDELWLTNIGGGFTYRNIGAAPTNWTITG